MCGQLNCLVTLFDSVTLELKILCWSASPLDFAEMSEPCALTAATKIAELRAELQKQKAAIAALTRKGNVADTSRACASDTAWPFVVLGALVVWAMRSDADLAEAFLEKWPQNQRAVAPWSQEQLREKMNTLTETEKEQLLRPTTLRGERAVTAATKFLTERSLFAWVENKILTRVWRPPMQLSGSSSHMKSTTRRSDCRGSRTPPQGVTSTSDSACKDGLAGGGSCRGGTRPDCGCRWKHFDRRPVWIQISSQKPQPLSKFGAEKCEFCDPSLVPRIRSLFLSPPIMRTIKGEGGNRAGN